MQAAKVGLTLCVDLYVCLEVGEAEGLDDDLAAQSRSVQTGDLDGELDVVHGREQLARLLVVELDVVELGRARSQCELEPADVGAYTVLGQGVHDLVRYVTIRPAGPDEYDDAKYKHDRER